MESWNKEIISDKLLRYRSAENYNSNTDALRFFTAIRGRESVLQFLALSRGESLRLRSLDINALLKSHEKLLKHNLGKNIRMHLILAAQLPLVKADTILFEQILLTLTDNLKNILRKNSSLTYETKYSDRESSFDAGDNFNAIAIKSSAVLTIKEYGFCRKDDSDIEDSKVPPISMTKYHGLEFNISRVSSMLKQQGGAIRWFVDSRKRHSIEVYLPTIE